MCTLVTLLTTVSQIIINLLALHSKLLVTSMHIMYFKRTLIGKAYYIQVNHNEIASTFTHARCVEAPQQINNRHADS